MNETMFITRYRTILNAVVRAAVLVSCVLVTVHAIADDLILSFEVTIVQTIVGTVNDPAGLNGATVAFTATFPDGATWQDDGFGEPVAVSSSHSFTITGASVPATNGVWSDPDGLGILYFTGFDALFIDTIALQDFPGFNVQGGPDTCGTPSATLCLFFGFDLDPVAGANEPSIGEFIEADQFSSTFTSSQGINDTIFSLGQSSNIYDIGSVVTPITVTGGPTPVELQSFSVE